MTTARRTGGRRVKLAVGQSTDSDKTDTEVSGEYTATHEMRAWARDNGHEVADRGRIPTSIVEAYKASHKASKLGIDGKVRPASKSRPTSKRRK
ncbi:Lsr2 dimerization domain-containing protein [Amycolatopsis lexingtonensis]|uniref:Lsr2 family DNA-binding protein n=1 Tax=Amycolatopsis lexingtonensis TaxID=218822 RepID=UPI001B7FF4C2